MATQIVMDRTGDTGTISMRRRRTRFEGRGALQGVDRRRLYRGGPYRVRRGGREAARLILAPKRRCFFPRLVGG